MSVIEHPDHSAAAQTVQAELRDIMTNPKNARHAGYWRQDREVLRHIESLYRKVHGPGKITIDGGLSLEATSKRRTR